MPHWQVHRSHTEREFQPLPTLTWTILLQDAQRSTLVEHLVLQELLKKRAPKLLAAFNAMDYSLEELAGPWFSHLFCGALPAETVVRVWDCLFLEGPKILFRVALAVLKVCLSFPPGK